MRTRLLFCIAVSLSAAILITHSASADVEVCPNFADLTEGSSVIGLGAVHSQLNIEKSGGNDVAVVKANLAPVAYGGNAEDTPNVANLCISSTGATV